MFTDEFAFTVRPIKNRLLVVLHRGQCLHPRFMVPNFKSGFQTVSAWVGFSFHGRAPLLCSVGGFNQHTYRAIIDNHILPSMYNVHNGPASFILQEDNCRPHRAKSIANYLANKEVTRMQWPPQSSDCNRIENVWDFLNSFYGREMSIRNTRCICSLFYLRCGISYRSHTFKF